MIFISFALVVTLATLSSAHPYGEKSARYDPQLDRTTEYLDIFSSYLFTTERRRVCQYKDKTYDEGSVVVTDEPCLKCKCLRGSLVCYLRVCPILPDPPPPQCVLVLRKGACCSELICEDKAIQTNHISRADLSAEEFPTNKTAYGDGCIVNGTLYASGSAMWTERPCEYCYCIAGKERCVKPRCLPPPNGCSPHRSPHSCCPVRYTCAHDHLTSSTTTTAGAPPKHRVKGCEVDGIFYPEGEKVTTLIKSKCDNCFCMKGMIRCVPLSCAPPLLGCTPVVLPGECCASSYNCSKRIADMAIGNELLFTSDGNQDTINERSFPDDTPLTPSQIAEILKNGDRIIRKIENNTNTTYSKNTTKIDLSQESKKSNISTTEQISSTIESTTISSTESDTEFTTPDMEFTTWTEAIVTNDDFNLSSPLENTTVTESTTKLDSEPSSTTNDSIIFDKSKTFINDTVNCTTEISTLDINVTVNSTSNSNDTHERILTSNKTDPILALDDSDDNFTASETSTNIDINPKFPSTSLIIPKDDDIFMVNVSTYVRTNSTVVTLRPVASIPPEIEALLNISLKKNTPKDDYYDYDYKSSLPPSLPNLEIIPFLATDAVDKNKNIDRYATVYPGLDEDKSYLGAFSTIPREKYNATVYPYIGSDIYNPTTFPSYTDEKYLSNPTNYPQLHMSNFNRNQVIYKQHINDKFQATTYKTILNDKFNDNRYGIDKFDATVYPSLTLEDSQTENPTFAFNNDNHNLFSPPSKTEGGFLPREPPLLNSYFNMGYSGSKDIPSPVTDTSLMVTDQTKPNTDDCSSNGRQYKNGELITEPNACVVCFCYYGDIHCQDPECPPIKPGCKRIVDIGTKSCCGIEICNDNQESSPTKTFDKEPSAQSAPEIVTISDRIDKIDPFKDVIRTEPAPDLESLIGDMPQYYSTSTTTWKPTTVKKSTSDLPTSTTEHVTFRSTSPIVLNVTKPAENTETTFNDYHQEKNTSYIEPIETTTFEDIISEDEDTDLFSKLSLNVLKYLGLSEDTDTTTKKPITTTTTTTTRTTTKPSSTTPNIFKTTYQASKYTSTPVTTKSILTTAANFFKNTYKYSFSKPNRTSPVSTIHKNFTKPLKYTTKQPLSYQSVRFTKPKYTYTSTTTTTTTTPSVTVPFKKITITSSTTTEEPIVEVTKKPSTTSIDPSLPFGGGLLKLAGCNIYGRMYRVGRIISELSGPCLECMCTEFGVQCTPLDC